VSKEMTVWGVGPRFTLLSVLYLALALVAHYVLYPLFVMRGISYALLIPAGVILITIGVGRDAIGLDVHVVQQGPLSTADQPDAYQS